MENKEIHYHSFREILDSYEGDFELKIPYIKSDVNYYNVTDEDLSDCISNISPINILPEYLLTIDKFNDLDLENRKIMCMEKESNSVDIFKDAQEYLVISRINDLIKLSFTRDKWAINKDWKYEKINEKEPDKPSILLDKEYNTIIDGNTYYYYKLIIYSLCKALNYNWCFNEVEGKKYLLSFFNLLDLDRTAISSRDFHLYIFKNLLNGTIHNHQTLVYSVFKFFHKDIDDIIDNIPYKKIINVPIEYNVALRNIIVNIHLFKNPHRDLINFCDTTLSIKSSFKKNPYLENVVRFGGREPEEALEEAPLNMFQEMKIKSNWGKHYRENKREVYIDLITDLIKYSIITNNKISLSWSSKRIADLLTSSTFYYNRVFDISNELVEISYKGFYTKEYRGLRFNIISTNKDCRLYSKLFKNCFYTYWDTIKIKTCISFFVEDPLERVGYLFTYKNGDITCLGKQNSGVKDHYREIIGEWFKLEENQEFIKSNINIG